MAQRARASRSHPTRHAIRTCRCCRTCFMSTAPRPTLRRPPPRLLLRRSLLTGHAIAQMQMPCRRAPLHDFPGEIPSFGWSKRAMTAATSFPSLRHRLGESACCSLHGSLRRRGQWTSGRRLRVVSDCASRWRSREQCEWQLYEVGLYLDIGWVASLSRLGGRGVGSVDAPQRGRSDFTSGRRPRMWCGVRGLRAVVLCSMGCG